MQKMDQLTAWATELQALAQAGLYYSKDVYDRERFQRIREIAAEMMAVETGLPMETVKDLFCNETGYQTPKLDSRAAVIQGDKILLVRENDGRWSLPGGWVDENLSIAENTVKELREEAGLEGKVDRLVAVQDRKKHNLPVYAHNICKVFFLCTVTGGAFQQNSETTESGWFRLDELPPLSENKNTAEQIRMCFDARKDENWQVVYD